MRGFDEMPGDGDFEWMTIRPPALATGSKGAVDTHTTRPEHQEPGEQHTAHHALHTSPFRSVELQNGTISRSTASVIAVRTCATCFVATKWDCVGSDC